MNKRKNSIGTDGNHSVGRSSNGGRNGSQDRVLKLKINKGKATNKEKPAVDNKKVIIQRIR